MEASMGRGRGRGLSNLPAWMTKATGAVGAVPAAAPTAPPKDEGLQVNGLKISDCFVCLFLFKLQLLTISRCFAFVFCFRLLCFLFLCNATFGGVCFTPCPHACILVCFRDENFAATRCPSPRSPRVVRDKGSTLNVHPMVVYPNTTASPAWPLSQEPPTPGRRALPPAPGQFENAADGGRSGRFGPQMRGGGGARGASGGAAGEGPSGESGMNFAERMMAKMGHKEGMGELSLTASSSTVFHRKLVSQWSRLSVNEGEDARRKRGGC